MKLTSEQSVGLQEVVSSHLKEKGLIDETQEITTTTQLSPRTLLIRVKFKQKDRQAIEPKTRRSTKIDYLLAHLTEEDWQKAMSFEGLQVMKSFLVELKANHNSLPVVSGGKPRIKYSNILTFHSKMKLLNLPYRLRSIYPYTRGKLFFNETFKLWKVKEVKT